MATWAAVFAVVLAAVVFIRTPVKRALQGKIIAVTDYMFWTKWGQPTDQYKGEDTSFVKTDTTQNISATQSEKDKYITYTVSSKVTENTVSSSVEDGSQALLRTLDLNTLPSEPVVEEEEEEEEEEVDCSLLNWECEVCRSDGKGGCECRWICDKE